MKKTLHLVGCTLEIVSNVVSLTTILSICLVKDVVVRLSYRVSAVDLETSSLPEVRVSSPSLLILIVRHENYEKDSADGSPNLLLNFLKYSL
jgi:hypothetical protein